MKTIFKILFMMTMIAASSCGNAQSPADTPKTLVVYYSYTGNCKAIANTLLSQIEADVLEIQPAEDNLDYAANNYELGSSLIARIRENPKSANSYPAIRPTDTDLQKYSSIIIVAPLWWNNMAAPLQTYLFLNGPKMKGKHVGLVVSSYSSGISDVVGDARRLVPECQFFNTPLWIDHAGHSRRSRLISDWLNDIGYTQEASTNGHKSGTIDSSR